MLERVQDRTGVVFYRSPLLVEIGVPHGFSTRIGGVSGEPFDSLNLGNPNGCPIQDDEANIAENYRRLQVATGCGDRQRTYVWQVHGAVVATALPSQPLHWSTKADAVATADPTRVAAVRFADCVPVLLSTADGRAVAAVHAGWRGVVAGVVPRAVEVVRGLRPTVQKLVAAVGPGIGFDRFEVGLEVVTEFRQAFGGEADALFKPVAGDSEKMLIDLQSAIGLQLAGLGIERDRVDFTDRCTVRDADEFFSHRREKGITGRMAALIGPVR